MQVFAGAAQTSNTPRMDCATRDSLVKQNTHGTAACASRLCHITTCITAWHCIAMFAPATIPQRMLTCTPPPWQLAQEEEGGWWMGSMPAWGQDQTIRRACMLKQAALKMDAVNAAVAAPNRAPQQRNPGTLLVSRKLALVAQLLLQHMRL